jgi:hypothetical protein
MAGLFSKINVKNVVHANQKTNVFSAMDPEGRNSASGGFSHFFRQRHNGDFSISGLE